jgi:hypothetical protein
MIKGILSFFKCCKSKPKPGNEDDIQVINSSEIKNILREYEIKESNFYTIEEDSIIKCEKRDIKNKNSKKNNDSIIIIESGNKSAVDQNANRYNNEEFENLKSYEKDLELYNKSIDGDNLKSYNSVLNDKSDKDFNKVLVPDNYIRNDEKEHIIFVN